MVFSSFPCLTSYQLTISAISAIILSTIRYCSPGGLWLWHRTGEVTWDCQGTDYSFSYKALHLKCGLQNPLSTDVWKHSEGTMSEASYPVKWAHASRQHHGRHSPCAKGALVSQIASHPWLLWHAVGIEFLLLELSTVLQDGATLRKLDILLTQALKRSQTLTCSISFFPSLGIAP